MLRIHFVGQKFNYSLYKQVLKLILSLVSTCFLNLAWKLSVKKCWKLVWTDLYEPCCKIKKMSGGKQQQRFHGRVLSCSLLIPISCAYHTDMFSLYFLSSAFIHKYITMGWKQKGSNYNLSTKSYTTFLLFSAFIHKYIMMK